MIISAVGFASVLALAFAGVPLGIALLLVGIVGFAVARASLLGQPLVSVREAGLSVDWMQFNAAFVTTGQQIFDAATNYNLTVVPLFVLMGAIIHRSNLSGDLYVAAGGFLGHRKGGMAMATIAACAGFAAVCGSSLAVAATMSRVAFPSMRRFKYADTLSSGAIAAGGTLGILIPPSVPMVIYGLLAGADIGSLFIAGVLPGIMIMLMFMATVSLVVRLDPDKGAPGPRVAWHERLTRLRAIWGVLLLFVLIIGGIYFGVFTPTEAAGVDAAGALIFGLLQRRIGWRDLLAALVESGITTGMVFLVLFGALVFSSFINLAGLTEALRDWVTSFDTSPMAVILAICLIYLVMGCVFDSLAILVLTVPLFASILGGMGVDLVWFGIIVVIVVELGLITPPIGMNVFVVSAATPGLTVWTVFRGVWPFVLAMLAGLGLIIAFPAIALWLPSLMS